MAYRPRPNYIFELRAEEAAKARGNMKIITPEPNQLFIDTDTDEAYNEFNKRFQALKKIDGTPFKNAKVTVYASSSGLPHRHIVVTFKDDEAFFSNEERIALQAILNSDYMHEFLCLKNLWDNKSPAIVFFEKSDSPIFKYMKPSNKSPEIAGFLEQNFGRTTAILSNKCAYCKGPATEFKDELSRKEFTIFGICQKCQDEIFG